MSSKKTKPLNYSIDMKKLLFAVAFAVLSFSGASAQVKTKIDKDGNYVQVSASGARAASPAVSTGKTFTDSKGKVYPVMKSGKGRLFVMRVSGKSGKEYKQYLN